MMVSERKEVRLAETRDAGDALREARAHGAKTFLVLRHNEQPRQVHDSSGFHQQAVVVDSA